ncbi:molybdopterin molybdotransferase MoeA [Paenibacillus sp. UNC451MF]|uniref:molybdopterin molybdotransferase MoeA n=1 Tax=Paenibacillus sp. UNC451MF TaxID=1449063 RepID=UPI0004914D64|nr:gephyrin-like molybdotransferase Glp [Paenibacillus sp. UNC451MF]
MSGIRFQRKAVSVLEAQQAVLGRVRHQEIEEVPLTESFGRRLAAAVSADQPMPHFRRSGVDGYAICASDSEPASPESSVTLEVVEHIYGGDVPQRSIQSGQASRIMTGAVVPDGADAVIMLEMTETRERHVYIRKRMAVGDNITPIGQEVAAGEMLLQEGQTIGAGETAILAAFGYSSVPVYRKPRVAIISTGSELLDVGKSLEPGKIRNSNSYMLACQVREAGGEAIIMPKVPDDPAKLEEELLNVMKEADLVLTTGGVSVGDKDVLVDVFERWEGELLFNKVAMRPGSPTSVGVWKDKLLFALSGNPGACFVGFELFVRPYLCGLMGCSARMHKEVEARLLTDYSKGSAYPRYVRGTLVMEHGMLGAKPAGMDKSSIMVSIKDADCLIHIPAGGRGASAGEMVKVLLLNH